MTQAPSAVTKTVVVTSSGASLSAAASKELLRKQFEAKQRAIERSKEQLRQQELEYENLKKMFDTQDWEQFYVHSTLYLQHLYDQRFVLARLVGFRCTAQQKSGDLNYGLEKLSKKSVFQMPDSSVLFKPWSEVKTI